MAKYLFRARYCQIEIEKMFTSSQHQFARAPKQKNMKA